MNLCPCVTFFLSHQSLEKTFQINSCIPQSHFSKLLFSVFSSLDSQAMSSLRFKPLDFKEKTLDFAQFYEKLPSLHQRSFQILTDDECFDFEQEPRLFSSPQNIQIKQSANHLRYKSLINNDNSMMKSPLAQSTTGGYSSPIDRTFFCFLDQMLDEEKFEAKEFFFLKCLFFEQRTFVLDFVIEALRDQDYEKFIGILRKLLEIKGFALKKEEGYNEKIEEILINNFESSEMVISRDLINMNEGTILATISVYNQENDEEELIDTMSRILAKHNELIQRKSLEASDKNYVKPIKTTEETREESELTIEKSREMEFSNKNNNNDPNKIDLNRNENKRNDNNLNENLNNENIDNNTIEDEKANDNTKKESMLAVIFKTLLEETEENFEAYEIGFAKHLFKISDGILVKILNTAETIEAAVDSIKLRIENLFQAFLRNNFKPEEIDYIQMNKCERSNEICSLFCSFKEKGGIDDLLKDLNSIFEAKKENEMFQSGCSDNKNNNTKIGGKFSSVVLSRNVQKKNSFRMLLMKEPNQQTTVNVRNSQNNLPMIVTINQTENQALKELLHNFHQREDIGNEKKKKNQKIFDEILTKLTLDNDTSGKLKGLLEKNHFGLLKVLNFYEKSNCNVKKIKGEIDKLMKRESVRDIDDVPSSPCLRNKIYKFNSFKQTTHELMDRYQLISSKQQKLFLYLYLSEDLTLLGAFEVFLVTNSLQDFVENLQIIDKFHFFKTNLDFDEIEQFDENVEFQLCLLFAYKKYLTTDQKTSLEKIIRAGDQGLLLLYQEFQQKKEKNEFVKGFVKLAEAKTHELKKLEQKMQESRMNGDKIGKNLDDLDTFKMSKFLKKVKYYDLIEEMVRNDHKLIRTAFEIYEMTKDKADFIENIELIYCLAYKKKFKEMIEETRFLGRKLKNEELHFLCDCIELDIPNILAPFEIYMLKIHSIEEGEEGSEEQKALDELVETIEISLRVYKKEIDLLEKTFYK